MGWWKWLSGICSLTIKGQYGQRQKKPRLAKMNPLDRADLWKPITQKALMWIYFFKRWLASDTVCFLQGKRKVLRCQSIPALFNTLASWFSPQGLLEEDNQWMTQINRLQKLIDRLEKKVGASFSFFSLSLFSTFWAVFPHGSNISR